MSSTNIINKIAFVFAHRPTDVWNTPLSVVNQFKALGCETRIYSLFDLYDNYTDSGVALMLEENRSGIFCPEMVMYMDWGRFDSPLLDKKNIPNAYWVMESGDDPQNFEKNSLKAHKFDLVLTPAHDSYLKYKEKGYSTLWWPHFADSNIHNLHNGYTPFEDLPPVRSTRGQGGSNLMDHLSQIMPNKFINRNGLVGQEYGDFLNSGFIVFQHSRWQEITRRIFEGMACGKLVITDRLPDHTNIKNLFVENEDIVYYSTVGECISKINYYLTKEAKEEALAIAERGYNKVMDKHTQIQRVGAIIKSYARWKESSL